MTTVSVVQADNQDSRSLTFTWVGADTNDGTPVAVGGFGAMSIQAKGNGTTVELQGSNDGGTTWGHIDSTITATVTGNVVVSVTAHPQLVKPVFTGGTATTFILSAAKQYY